MTVDPMDDLTADERRAYAALREGPLPPPGLEDRVVDDLRRRGLLESGPRSRGGAGRRHGGRGWWRLAAAAVLAATFLFGFGAGRWSTPTVVPGGTDDPPVDRYLLLLYETPEQMSASEDEVARLVAEYSAWADEQRRAGSLVAGEKLADDGLVVVTDDGLRVTWEPGAGTSRVLTGFFQVRAGSYQEARRIAESCPHLEHGGEIEIRRIE